jgi:hypothetical protein
MLKDEDLIKCLANSLETLVDFQTFKTQPMLELAENLINHLRMFNKKAKDIVWSNLIVKILLLYSKGTSYIELAFEMGDPLNNQSS